ncbi:hypothetical protein [Candidatus Babela massiliensis]|uniref:Uncharacterized protein n=1 Tax=Candidatus Babela massiliensis TaxID=673862 RepID=V6DF99_9BACT|nr:hypothetical protein [Candidatus Babela massiliensis]CDK30250.1 hypothetical protein BABL1_gene_944 [Candidatus Babela massiliensis]
MKFKLRKLISFSLILSVIAIFYSFSDNFLSTPSRRRSIGQIKQEIAETLGIILNQNSKMIESIAHNQQEIYRAIIQLANNEKNSPLVKASKRELEESLNKLKIIKDDNDKHMSKIVEFFKMARTNFIEKDKNKERC